MRVRVMYGQAMPPKRRVENWRGHHRREYEVFRGAEEVSMLRLPQNGEEKLRDRSDYQLLDTTKILGRNAFAMSAPRLARDQLTGRVRASCARFRSTRVPSAATERSAPR